MKFLDVPQSGSYAGVTSSRNRYGQYKRTRAIPVNPNTGFQGTVRARMATNAAAWRNLTANQRAGWADLGLQMNRTDGLGQSYNLTGFQAYCSVNANQAMVGNAILTDAPILTTPSNVATVTLTLTNASFSVAFTATPLPAGTRLCIWASPMKSAGVNFTNNLKLITVTAAAATSPSNILAAYAARCGGPLTGSRIFVTCKCYLGGFLSGPLAMSQIVA